MNFAAVIFANDVKNLATFYASLCSLETVYSDPDKAVLQSDVLTLTIHGIPADISASIAISSPPEVRESTPIKLCFPVATIQAARQTAGQMGGTVYPLEKEWENDKFRACDGYDPEGNVFQVRQAR